MKRLLLPSIGSLGTAIVIYGFVAAFLLYPMAIIFIDSIYIDGAFTLDEYVKFFSNPFNTRIFTNSIITAVATVVTSSLVGVTLAYIMSRYRIRGRSLIMTISLLPMIMPPFVGALAFIFLLGRTGTINLILMDWLGLIDAPINFIRGVHGVILMETIHLYPLIYLNAAAAFTSIDPALEEAAEIQGASGLRRFFTVTLPLATPGYAAGAFLVFIWTLADWTTPSILGQASEYLAPQAFSNSLDLIDQERFRQGLAGSALIALFSIFALIAMRKYVGLRQYVSLTKGTTAEGRILELKGVKRKLAYTFILGVATLSLLGPTWLILTSFAGTWGITPFPTSYTLEHYQFIIVKTTTPLTNSLEYSAMAAVIDLIFGVIVAYALAREKILGKDMLDGMVTMVLAVPGLVLGVGYLTAFHRLPLPLVGEPLTRIWIVMPLIMAVRRAPYVVRSSYASLLQLDVAFEEASDILGASRVRTFTRITLPLIIKGVLAGAILSFVTAIQEVSATMFVYRPGWETIPILTFIEFTSSGNFGVPASLGVILLGVTALSIAVANRIGGRKLGGAFGV